MPGNYREFDTRDNGRFFSFRNRDDGFKMVLSGNPYRGLGWMLSHINDELVTNFDSDKAHTDQFVITRKYAPYSAESPQNGGVFEFFVTPKPENIKRKKYYHFKLRIGTEWMEDEDADPRLQLHIKYI